jgi:tetratricopeptide (TPR) repeat protein
MKFILLLLCTWASHSWAIAQANTAERYLKQGKEKLERKDKRAITDFSISLEIEPSIEAYFLRAAAKVLAEDLIGAISDLDDAIRLDGYDPILYNNRGNLKDELERSGEAVKDYEKAILLDSTYSLAYYNRGIALFNLEKYEEAKQDFEKVSKLKTIDIEAIIGLGLCLIRLNKNQEACLWFEKAKTLNPALAEEFLKQNCR